MYECIHGEVAPTTIIWEACLLYKTSNCFLRLYIGIEVARAYCVYLVSFSENAARKIERQSIESTSSQPNICSFPQGSYDRRSNQRWKVYYLFIHTSLIQIYDIYHKNITIIELFFSTNRIQAIENAKYDKNKWWNIAKIKLSLKFSVYINII